MFSLYKKPPIQWKYINSLYKTFSSIKNICWNCKNATTDLFCPSCKFLQRPDPQRNYFQVLDVGKSYDLDDSTLSNKLKHLQKQLHPDKFSNKSAEEQKVSEEYSSLVNKAYSTLIQPLSRGLYLLKLNGIEIEEKTQLESEFLMEIMEKNEEVESAETEEEILNIEKENKEIISGLRKQLSVAFSKDDLAAAQSILIKMKYYDSIDNLIKSIIRRMKIVK